MKLSKLFKDELGLTILSITIIWAALMALLLFGVVWVSKPTCPTMKMGNQTHSVRANQTHFVKVNS